MSFISELMDNIKDAAEAAITPEPPAPAATGTRGEDPTPTPPAPPEPAVNIVYGSDPPIGGICMIQGAGFPTEEHRDKGMLYQLPVLLNGKNASQELILDYLTAIHAALTKTTAYADLSTEAVQVINIRTTASPNIIGREQNNQWICGSSFEVSFYWRV